MSTQTANPIWTARHVKSLSDLPAKLTPGRAYFVNDEQYILVDYGNGPTIYGRATPGPQGKPGEPIPELQAQIDFLTSAAITTSQTLQNFNEARKNDIQFLFGTRAVDLAAVYMQIKQLSTGIMHMAALLSDTCENLRATENILLQIVIDAQKDIPVPPVGKDEIITTIDGLSWKIIKSDGDKNSGEILFEFEPETHPAPIVLMDGEILQSATDDNAWKIVDSSGNQTEGTIIFDLEDEHPLAQGEVLTSKDGTAWSVAKSTGTNDDGEVVFDLKQ